MTFIYSNFAETVLLADLSELATSAVVSPTDVNEFTQPSGAQRQRLYIRDDTGHYEFIDLVTNDLSGTFIISRTKEGTVARNWPAGAKIAGVFSAEVLQAFANSAADAAASAVSAASYASAAAGSASAAAASAVSAANSASDAFASASAAQGFSNSSAAFSGRNLSSVVVNPVFNDYRTGDTVPYGWTAGTNGAGSRDGGSLGTYSHRMLGPAGSDAWIYQDNRPAAPGPYYAEFTAELLSGTWAGAGIKIEAKDGSNIVLATFTNTISSLIDTNGDTSATKIGIRSFRPAPITFPANTTKFAIYLYAHNVTLGSTSVANLMDWHQGDLHPANYTEALSVVSAASIVTEATTRASADSALSTLITSLTATVGTNTANISTNSSAIATLNSSISSLSTTVSANGASITTIQTALAGGDGTHALLAFKVDTGSNAATIVAFSTSGGTWSGSAIALSATYISLRADAINFGANTTFETTYNTLYTTNNSFRYRSGGPFGASSNMLIWYGPTSTALNSESASNCKFAIDNGGHAYRNGLEFGSNSTANTYYQSTDPVGSFTVNNGDFWGDTTASALKYRSGGAWVTIADIGGGVSATASPTPISVAHAHGSFTSGTITITPSGGSGYTYQWQVIKRSGAAAAPTLSADNASTATLSGSVGSGQDVVGQLLVVVSSASGKSTTVIIPFNFSSTD